jgi:cyanophycinase
MKFHLLIFLFSFHSYASTLVLIGGGNRPKEALSYFVKNKKTGPIYVLPWGTIDPQGIYKTIKSELSAVGATDVRCFCHDNWTLEDRALLENSGGIYFPGGDQNLIMEKIKKYHLKKLIQKLYENHIPVAGTSAGTAIQSDPMLTGIESNTTEGLGLLSGFIIDQHFIVRNREERLLRALNSFSYLNGIGVDEDMSVVIQDKKKVLALGPSVISIYLREENQLKKVILHHQESLFLVVPTSFKVLYLFSHLTNSL